MIMMISGRNLTLPQLNFLLSFIPTEQIKFMEVRRHG